jgi:hypothetical protein
MQKSIGVKKEGGSKSLCYAIRVAFRHLGDKPLETNCLEALE